MKIPLLNGKPHEIIELVNNYLLTIESIYNKEEIKGEITFNYIKRKILKIIAQYTGIENGIIRHPNKTGKEGVDKLIFLKETVKGCRTKLNIDEKQFKIGLCIVKEGKEQRNFKRFNKEPEQKKLLN